MFRLNKSVLLFFIFFNYFAAEVKVEQSLITHEKHSILMGFLTDEEIDDWNSAESQDDLKKAFIYIFYHIKEFFRDWTFNLKYFNDLVKEFELLYEDLKIQNTKIDEEIIEVKEEIAELKETLLKNKRIKTYQLRYDPNSIKYHSPPMSIRQEWNNAITTHEQKRIMRKMMFAALVAINMGGVGIITEDQFIKIVKRLNWFRAKVGINDRLSNDIQNELNAIAANLESGLLD